MERVLIVSSPKNKIPDVLELLRHAFYSEIAVLENGGEARRLLLERSFDLCIIHTPLPDEFGEGLAMDIVADSITQVILIVKSELLDVLAQQAEMNGIFIVERAVDKDGFWSVLRMAGAVYNRLCSLKTENKKLVQSIEDMRMITRAKCLLIERMKMSEAEAHKYIEKQAMDRRLTKRAVAERILKTFES